MLNKSEEEVIISFLKSSNLEDVELGIKMAKEQKLDSKWVYRQIWKDRSWPGTDWIKLSDILGNYFIARYAPGLNDLNSHHEWK